ncbi:MAG: hypothetical protein ACUVT1_08770 [Anaerolineae bacterium]
MAHRTKWRLACALKLVAALLSLLLMVGLPACQRPAPPPAPEPTLIIPPTAVPTAAPVGMASLPQPITYLSDMPDGSTQLHLMDGGQDLVLGSDLDGFVSLQWSPDGRWGLAAVRTPAEKALLWIDGPARSSRRLLSASLSEPLRFLVAASWNRLLAVGGDAGRRRVWSVSLPVGEARPLAEPAGEVAVWAISPDGRWGLIGAEAGGRFVSTLFRLDTGEGFDMGDMPHPLVEFSPDSRWLAMVGREAGEDMDRMLLYDLRAEPPGAEGKVVARAGAIRPVLPGPGKPAAFFSEDSVWLTAELRQGAEGVLRVRHLEDGRRAEMSLGTDVLEWMTAAPGMPRGLVARSNGGAVRLLLWYFDLSVEIPFLENMHSIAPASRWQDGKLAVQAELMDGRMLVAFEDVPAGSSYIVLRGWLRPLAVDLAGGRVMAGLGRAGQEDVHILDVKAGGTLAYMGYSAGDESRPARGGFAPFGPAAWALLWDAAGDSRLVLAAERRGFGTEAARNVDEVGFAPSGQWVLFTHTWSGESGIYIAGADGSGVRRLASGGEPRWHPGP